MVLVTTAILVPVLLSNSNSSGGDTDDEMPPVPLCDPPEADPDEADVHLSFFNSKIETKCKHFQNIRFNSYYEQYYWKFDCVFLIIVFFDFFLFKIWYGNLAIMNCWPDNCGLTPSGNTMVIDPFCSLHMFKGISPWASTIQKLNNKK